MWRLKDWIINILLDIRLWFLVNFKPSRFNVSNNIEKEGWDLTFNDEFDEGKLNRDKWRTDAYFGRRYHPGNIEKENKVPDQYFSDDLFEFKGSVMRQLASDEPKEIHHVDWSGKDWGKWTIPYQMGAIDSSSSFEQQYGYFEIRSKMPDQPGHWPAFWLASVHAWPPEIDIYEIYTGKRKGKGIKRIETNFHWIPEPNKKSKVRGHKVLDTSKGFHLYAVEWDEKYFKVYYDNLLVRVFTNPETLREFKYPMHIIINNGLDVRPENGISKAKFPSYHDVDYVRAYKNKRK